MIHKYLFIFRYVDDIISIRLRAEGQCYRKITGRMIDNVLPEIQKYPEGGKDGRVRNTVPCIQDKIPLFFNDLPPVSWIEKAGSSFKRLPAPAMQMLHG